ncbi:MAG: protein kinase, partial [Chloroflexota bacterium]
MPLLQGTILENRYRIEKLLSRGGMGAVYLATDTKLQIQVAIKENFFQTEHSIRQFEQEALILARVHHPNLPRVIDHFTVKSHQYLVMDFIDGKDLWDLVQLQGYPLEEKQALTYIIQICQAVSYLHHQKPAVLHRDIKPQNIKISSDNRAMLVDFGIAKVVGKNKEKTRAGAQAVTPGFSPPEQYQVGGTTPASDVYALGATLYAILTGKKPPNSISLLANKKSFIPPVQLNDKLSKDVSEAITWAMSPSKEERPQAVAVWQEQLEKILASENLDDETLKPGAIAPKKEQNTLVQATRVGTTGTYWLVDGTGRGHVITEKPLVIGRQSSGDVVVDDLAVSRHHALIRRQGNLCLVKDNNSANGTLLNGQSVGSDWQQINVQDQLTIGSSQFRIKSENPAQIAPVPVVASASQANEKEQAEGLSEPVTTAPPTDSKSRKGWLYALMALIVLGGIVGAIIYFVTSRTSEPKTSIAVVETETATPEVAERNEPTEELVEVTGTATATVEPTEATNQAAASEPTETPSPSPVPTETEVPSTFTPIATSTEAAPTTVPATDTPSSTPTPPPNTATAIATESPQVTGPTIVPVVTTESRDQLGEIPVIDIDINPNNPNEVYALVNKPEVEGIYKSINGGTGPWHRLDLNAAGLTDFVIDPHNSLRFYAPGWNAVFRSEDGGNSWKPLSNGLAINQVAHIVTVDPVDPNLLYVGIGESFAISTDGGTSWTADGFGNGLSPGEITSIVVDPFQNNIVLIGGKFGSLYRSVDSGRNFIQLAFNTGEG